MLRKRIFSLAVPAVAAAALLFAAGPSWAAGHGAHGGHWGGGFHGAAGYHGGYHGAVGYHRGYYPGHYGSYYHRYYPRFYGYGLGLYPWYGYGVYPYSSYEYGYSPTVSSAYDVVTVPENVEPALAPPLEGTAVAPASTAQLNVSVPADAEVWVQGMKTSRTGTFRQFVSPPLEPGSNYTYEIRARWMQDGQVVDRTQTISVQAGASVNVDFLRPPAGT
jgi:uncharacterized protein (TIGR03000 family)